MTVVRPGLASPRVEPATVSTPSTALQVKRATITFDRTWSPYIQGTLTCRAQSGADATATDPRNGLAVKFTLTQQVDAGAQQSLPLVAWLRSRSNDLVNDEATLTFASVEALLQESGDIGGMSSGLPMTDVAIINQALTAVPSPVVSSITTVDGSAAYTVAAADVGWDVNTSPWAVVSGLEDGGGLWARGDETGTALLRMQPGYSADTSTHTIAGTDRILSVIDTVDRDNPAWANRVGVTWRNVWEVANAAGSSGPRKQMTVVRKVNRPAAGSTQAIANRWYARGRTLTVTAIADLACRPNQTWRAIFRGYDWTGKVQAVTFRYPEGLMDLTLNI